MSEMAKRYQDTPSYGRLSRDAQMRTLRSEIAEITENIASMLGPLCDAAERHGWNNASVVEGQAIVAMLERERDTAQAKLRLLEKVSA